MDEITWPVTMVDPTGNHIKVSSVLAAHEAAMTSQCLLLHPVPGLNLAVATRAGRADGPRQLPTARRTNDAQTAADIPDPVAAPEPPSRPRTRRGLRNSRAGG